MVRKIIEQIEERQRKDDRGVFFGFILFQNNLYPDKQRSTKDSRRPSKTTTMSFSVTSNPEWFTSTWGSGGPLSLWRYSGGTSGNPQYVLNLNTSGQIGIGTSAPLSTLEILNPTSSFVATRFTRPGAFLNYGIGEQYDLISNTTSFRASYVRTLGCVQSLATTNVTEATGSFIIDCVNDGVFATDTDSTYATMVITPTKTTCVSSSFGIGAVSPLAKLAIFSNNSSQFGLDMISAAEPYANTTSTRSIYMKAGTVASISNVHGTANSATLIDFGAYQNLGNTNVYFGAVAGSTANGPAHFVVGRRTGVSSWAETVRVTDGGRLGVGTSAPTKFIDFRDSTDPCICLAGVNGSLVFEIAQAAGSGWYSASAVRGDVVLRNEDSTKKIHIQSGPLTSVLTVTNAHVGVNNANPTVPFDVFGTDNRIAQFRNTADYARILLNGSGGGDLIFQDAGTSKFGVACISGNLQFLINDSTSTVPMSIFSTGNVSVGTASDIGARLVSARDITLIAGNYAGDVGCQLMATGATNTNKRLALMYDTTNDIGLIQSMVYGTGPKPLILNAAGGNVGIGVTTPRARLQVDQGYGNNDNGIIVTNSNYGSDQYLLMGMYNRGSGNFYSYAKLQGKATGVSASVPICIQPEGGNVGIGTDSPSTTLELMHTTGFSNLPFLRLNNSLGGAGNQVGICLNPYSSRPGGDTSKIVAIDDGAASSALTFWTAPTGNEGNTTSVERMRILPNGNVGIGATVPPFPLTLNATNVNCVTGTNVSTTFFIAGSYGQNGAYLGFAGMYFEGGTNYNQNTYVGIGKSDSSGLKREVMRMGEFGGAYRVGINNSTPAYDLDVNGTIARSGVRLPRFDNGNFSDNSGVVVPILFSDTGYNYLEIKIRYVVSDICNISIQFQDTNGGYLGFSECALTTVRWNNQGTPVYTTFTGGVTSGLFANDVERAGIDNNVILRIIRSTGGTNAGLRNHYSYDNVYCWAGIGTTRGYGMGHIDNAYVGGPALGSMTLVCSTGTISGTWSTVHSY